MFEGFINEHHLFADDMPVVKLGGSSSQSLLIGEGASRVFRLFSCSRCQEQKGGSPSSQAPQPRNT